MPQHFPLMVRGAQADSQRTEVFSPYDGSLIATVDRAGRGAVERALETAYRLFRNRDAWLGPTRRLEILERTAEIMQGRRKMIVIHSNW